MRHSVPKRRCRNQQIFCNLEQLKGVILDYETDEVCPVPLNFSEFVEDLQALMRRAGGTLKAIVAPDNPQQIPEMCPVQVLHQMGLTCTGFDQYRFLTFEDSHGYEILKVHFSGMLFLLNRFAGLPAGTAAPVTAFVAGLDQCSAIEIAA